MSYPHKTTEEAGACEICNPGGRLSDYAVALGWTLSHLLGRVPTSVLKEEMGKRKAHRMVERVAKHNKDDVVETVL